MFRRRCTWRRRRVFVPLRGSLAGARANGKPDSCVAQWSLGTLSVRRNVRISWKEPREKVHCSDSHTNAEQDAGENALGAAFAKRESQTGNHDGDQRKTARDGARKCLLEDANGIFPGRIS